MALIDKLNAIGDAIRAKTGKSEKLTLDEMPIEIAGIPTGGGDDTMVGVWIFNEVLELYGFNFYVNFVLPNVADSLPVYNLYSDASLGDELYCIDDEENMYTPYENGVWVLPDWRTITITEEPTDAECIAWLKANARKATYEAGFADGEKAILSTYVDWSVSTTSNSCVVNVNNDNDYYAHIHLFVEEITNALDYDDNIVVPPFESFEIYQGEMGLDDLSGAEWFVLVTIERFSKDGV